MAQKKRKKGSPPQPPRFRLGEQVRVKPGTTDPDFSDFTLGGWVGTIQEVDQRSRTPLYLIRWNQQTLGNMHPVYRKRCERDGLEIESMWLGEGDLELDGGTPASIERPTSIRSRPLNPKDQDDRIRAVFCLTSDDTLPDVDDQTLQKYHAYLSSQLSFPFPAKSSQERKPFSETAKAVEVTGLLAVEDSDDMDGLLCEATESGRRMELPLGEIEVTLGNPHRKLIEDYSYWFWNWR